MFLHTLDNTSWSIADIIGPIGTGTHNFFINFTANETEYASIHFVGDANSGHVYYDDTLVASYPLTVWEDAAYQQIAIAGGIDATNPALLAWFKQYAKNATPSGGDVDIIGALNDIAEAISGGGSGGGLPDTTEASVGDVLSLDEDKKPTWAAPTGGSSFFGNKIFSGTVTDTPQPIEIRQDRFAAMPMYVGTINGEPITYMELHVEVDGAYWDIRNNNNDEIRIRMGADGITIAAYYGDCEVELIDMGPRFVSVPGLLLQGVIHVHYPIFVLGALAFEGCGLALVVNEVGTSYAPIVFCSGSAYFSAEIHIGSDYYSDWTVDPETGAITGTTGGSNASK